MDSSAVTATAARLDPAESILAFTSAPRSGFDGPVPVGRIADETGLAALVALAHPNIQHIVCRPAGMKPLALLGRTHALAQQPTGHVCNNSWWCAINDAARDRGVTVMLTGELGNLAFSAGGYSTLEDLVRAGRIGRWLGEARASGLPWRTLADFSFAGLLPASLNDRVRRFFTNALPPPAKPPFLAADHHALAEVPPLEASSARALQLELIRRTDPGCFRKAVLAGWGIDERDPTADRDLVEFCLTLPLDALLKDGVERPLLKATLADRLPPELLNQSLRGYQMADWYEQIRPADVRDFASELRKDHRAAALLDWNEVEEAIDAWPNGGWEQRPLIYRYRMRLLRALAAAEFVRSRPDHALQPIARSAG
jgi:asparagine synthase (glutamine-hydrolysing)